MKKLTALIVLGIAGVTFATATDWPGGVVPQPSPFGAPVYYIVFGPIDVDHGNTSSTIPGGTVSSCPGYYSGNNPYTYHDYTHSSVRPDLTFAGKFFGLCYSHQGSGSYYDYAHGYWTATDYTPAQNPGGGSGN